MINLIKCRKSEHYSSIIKENFGNQKVLSKTVQKLLQKPTVNYYPPSENDRMLADDFAIFFTTKIDTLHNDLLVKKKALIDSAKCVTDEVLTMSSTKFSTLTEMKLDGIRELAAKVLSKSCVLDPLPSSIIKQCTDLLLPTITNIVNLSLHEGCMPTCLKSAVLSPLLKKPDADFLQFKNFRHISNLKALSKIIEKSVALQLNNYLMNNNLHENFQSAYKVHHSTETVMLKVQDDILHAIDSNKAVVLLTLDLSATFDTVSHEILLDRLSQRYSIAGSVDEWFASYLSSRTQFVQIESSRSSLRELKCGVSQGSVLAPLLYVLYTSPVADIIKRHNLTYHLYAGDTQLYVSFKLGSDDLLSSTKFSIEIYVQEINNWMILNGLKLNEEETELLLLSSRFRPSPSLEFVRAGGETIQQSSSVRNLGVILDPSADMENHIKKICKTCHFHLTNINKIRTYLDRESTEAIIHAFVTTNLDYCNAILYGLPKLLLNRLQLVQNRAARIVTFKKKYEHITPSLIDLHRLPVEYRIIDKILLLVICERKIPF